MPDEPRPAAPENPPRDDDHGLRPEPPAVDSAGALFAPVAAPGEAGAAPEGTDPPSTSDSASPPASPAGRAYPEESEPAPPADDAAFLDVRCSLAPEKLRADYTVHSIQTGVLACIAVGVGIVRLLTAPDYLVLGLQSGIVLVALLTYKLGTDAFARASYRRSSYRVSADGLEIRRGVIWRTVTTIPSSRVQHTDVSRGPLERMFKIATLAIHTAGTSNATVLLPGLPSARALRIRDYLLEARDAFDAV